MSSYEYIGSELNVFALAVNWKRYFAQLIRPFLHGHVLEVGAGIGETTLALWRPGLGQWTALEPDARMAKGLRSLAFPGGTHPEVVVGDIGSIDPTAQFDTIVYIDVLEHIHDDARQLEQAARRLAPGGHLIVLSPAYQALYSAFDRAIGHERRYTRHSLEAAFPSTLVRVKTFYADAVGMLLSFANSLILRQSLPSRRQILFWDRVVIPLSRRLDPLVGRRFGRSVIAIYRKER